MKVETAMGRNKGRKLCESPYTTVTPPLDPHAVVCAHGKVAKFTRITVLSSKDVPVVRLYLKEVQIRGGKNFS